MKITFGWGEKLLQLLLHLKLFQKKISPIFFQLFKFKTPIK